MSKNGLALQYASLSLCNDKDVVIAAIKNNPEAFKYATNRLRNDPEFVETVSVYSSKAQEFAGNSLKNNSTITLYNEIKTKYVFDFESEEVKNDLLKIYSKNKIENEKEFSLCLNINKDKKTALLLADYLYRKKDFCSSAKYYLSVLPIDNANVYKTIGSMYRYGKGVSKDPVEACVHFNKAIELGDYEPLSSLVSLFKTYAEKVDRVVNFDKLYKYAVESHNAKIQNDLDTFATYESRRNFFNDRLWITSYSDDYDYLIKWFNTQDHNMIVYFSTLSFKQKIGKDKEKVLYILENTGRFIPFVDKELLKDKDVLSIAITWGPDYQKYIDSDVFADFDLLELAIKCKYDIKKLLTLNVSFKLLTDMDELKKLINLNKDFFNCLPDELKNKYKENCSK